MTITAVRAYRALLRLYPRRFRDEYGPDMALLFADQLRDEPAARVWARSAIDLALTIPTQHLEAHMNRAPSALLPVLFTATGIGGVGIAAVGGSSRGMLTIGLSIAVVALGLAAVARRNLRPVGTDDVSAHWWKLVSGGAGMLAAFAGVTTFTGELPEGLWWPMIIVLFCALGLIGTGVVLGIAHAAARPRHAAG
jgi:hypothetical protein